MRCLVLAERIKFAPEDDDCVADALSDAGISGIGTPFFFFEFQLKFVFVLALFVGTPLFFSLPSFSYRMVCFFLFDRIFFSLSTIGKHTKI